MKYMFKEIPKNERPRERLVKYGADALADYELLAIILRTGTKDLSVLDVARQVTMKLNSLSDLNEITLAELESIKGIGRTKAIELLAVAELGKRISRPRMLTNTISSPLDTYYYLREKMQHLNQETLTCIYLNTKSEVICDKVLTVGTLDHTIFHPRDILKWGLKYSAYGFIIAHNHPSGDASPSKMDIQMTKIIIEAAKTIGICFIDHVIIGKNKYYSFVEKKVSNVI
ncbi:MAG TPA: DNA repair protein RadC [Acholeplasmataceae bacterium]|nr:DNA repair protein RadC [Acholeplasmataceae bacterium]